ncbi:c2H2-type domain-containing protein [Trichonephila clavata]|uniref:C2H2-type domain-containing protein n=1 Tax=Trichonephila clavata TaxID=2740835 RepID=A0A8X6H3U0_TRICU|nr:c2H2-type domain-containing protein [Trichonephila clavata]
MCSIMPMVENPEANYDKNTCHICKQKFKKDDIRVRDHYHWGSGYILGLAHQSCNLNYRATYFVPVVIHNSRNYDTHLILKNLPPNFAKIVNIIPINMEKFTMFSLDALKFIDSFQFLDSSLDVLVNNLKTSDHEFKIFETFFGSEKNKHLLKQKGIFPYSYLDSLEKLNEPHLPSQRDFYNILTSTSKSDKDYEHAQLVYKYFKCKKLANYLELYQNVNTIMLAEVFTSFRRKAMRYYELDPIHFVTSAELTWNAGLKFTKVELQLLTNVNDYIWFESQMRGGICFLGKRHDKANNPYVAETYDEKKPRNYIVALDANNLYGFVMSQPLPVGNFSWLTPEEISDFNVFNYDQNSKVGFIIEVDLKCPKQLQLKTNDLPLAPEHLNITYNMLSPYSKRLCDKFNLKHVLPSKKLTPNFYPKKNYITHYLNLQFYIEEGMIVEKYHRILAFSQHPWLAEYIHFLITKKEKRQKMSLLVPFVKNCEQLFLRSFDA